MVETEEVIAVCVKGHVLSGRAVVTEGSVIHGHYRKEAYKMICVCVCVFTSGDCSLICA